MSSTVEMCLPAEPGSVKRARDAVLTLAGLEEDTCDRARIVVSELFTNCLRDSCLQAKDIVEIHLSVHHGCIAGEIACPPVDIDLISMFSRSDLEHDEGRGLRIVDRLVDEWGVAADGTTRVWFEIEPHS